MNKLQRFCSSLMCFKRDRCFKECVAGFYPRNNVCNDVLGNILGDNNYPTAAAC